MLVSILPAMLVSLSCPACHVLALHMVGLLACDFTPCHISDAATRSAIACPRCHAPAGTQLSNSELG